VTPDSPLLVIPRQEPLFAGTLIKRYKRFLSDIRLDDGRVVTAHCVNTGSMEGLTRPGLRVWVSGTDNPNRKLKFTWELTEIDGEVIGTNTSLPNRLTKQLLEANAIPWLRNWDEVRPEKKYGKNSRIDFWLRRGRNETYVEVKNNHLKYPDGRAYFPDSVSERASKHLEELAEVISKNVRAHVLFFCQMPDPKAVRPSDVHDPVFAETARKVKDMGVTFSGIAVRHTPNEIVVTGRVPVDLKPYATRRVTAWRDQNKKLKNDPIN